MLSSESRMEDDLNIPASLPVNISLDTVKQSIGYPFQFPATPTICPLSNSSPDYWQWDPVGHGPKAVLVDETTVVFHPLWSNSTQAVRGTRILNDPPGRIYYWEVVFVNRVFGTAMMVGLGTADARTQSESFEPLIGENEESWGLSHKGYLYHNKARRSYCRPFEENTPTVVGVLYNGLDGTVTFYKDGVSLGLAFSGLNKCKKVLYPMVCSTAAKTVMHVRNMWRGFDGLQDRCRDVILRSLSEPADILTLPLPYHLQKFMLQQSWKTRIGKDGCFIDR